MATNERGEEWDEGKRPADREAMPQSIDEREEDGWTQPESSAQKLPAKEPEGE